MKVTKEAIEKAKLRTETKANIDLCVKENVCPECAEDLKQMDCYFPPIGFPFYSTRDYECTSDKCDFKHTEIIKS